MIRLTLPAAWTMLLIGTTLTAQDFDLQMRSSIPTGPGSQTWRYQTEVQRWPAEQTAVIVCDVWDLHHCLNAVRRLEEFAPRLDAVLVEARRRGATIIHAPSDCMAAYERHPARRRAIETPRAKTLPRDIEHWCSQIPAEAATVFPIDQSDGGEDDDPVEHAAWVAKLTAMGRKPGTPWQAQSSLITIDAERDYISDRGDEVWSILQARGIRHVILTGVHTNMCVLGRPFGLRQMVRNGMPVVLMRDLTDSMYNPQRWPYVDHFTGHDLVIEHVERHVCPTITSDQLLGGEPFRSKFDTQRSQGIRSPNRPEEFSRQWSKITLPGDWKSATDGLLPEYRGPAWYRCVVRAPSDWIRDDGLQLVLPPDTPPLRAWFNGQPLVERTTGGTRTFTISRDVIEADDANLLVLRCEHTGGPQALSAMPIVRGRGRDLSLQGRHQFRLGDDGAWSGIPLPARYGMPPEVVFEPAR